MNEIAQWLVPSVFQLIVAAFVYGQLAQRQKDQGGWLKKHDSELADHKKILFNHEGRLSHVEGRKGLPHGAE